MQRHYVHGSYRLRPTLLLYDKHRIFMANNLTEVLVLFTVLVNVTILSIIIVLESASIEITNVVYPHNGQIL